MLASSHLNPSFFPFLQQLSFIHHSPHNPVQTLQQLTFIIQSAPHAITDYLPSIVNYHILNIQRNIQLLRTVDSLIALHKHLSIPLRKTVSSLLIKKYPYTDFRQQLKKLACINYALIEPYFFLLSRISEWHQFQALDRSNEAMGSFEFLFLLSYFRTLVMFEFETGKVLEGVGPWQPLLSIYSLMMQEPKLLDMGFERELKGLASSIFYFLANQQITDLEKAKKIFIIIDALMSQIQQVGIHIQEQILSELMSILRKSNSVDRGQFIDAIQNGIKGLLCVRWSLDREFQWSWVCKIVWDLMDIEPKQQLFLIKELVSNVREILRHLELL